MGSILGGGGNDGGGLAGLLGGLPDPLGIGKLLGITKDKPDQPTPMPSQGQPQGVNFAPQPGSGVSFNPSQMLSSPMGPTGFGVGAGSRPPRG